MCVFFLICFAATVFFIFLLLLELICGDTPLHFAARFNRLEVCAFLLQNDANPFIKNNENKTPLDEAKSNSIRQIIQRVQLQLCQASYIQINSSSTSFAPTAINNKNEQIEKLEKEIKYHKLEQQVSDLKSDKVKYEKRIEILEKEVKVLKENEFTFVMSEVKIIQINKYEKLLEELLGLQTQLLSEQNMKERLDMIEQRNAKRREIVTCINEITIDVKNQVVRTVNRVVEQMIAKKLEHFLPIKSELEKDIEMEDRMSSQSNEETVQKLEEQLKELLVDLQTFQRRKYIEQAQQVEQEIHELEKKIEKKKEMTSVAITKRVNPLFGFPEYQSSILQSIDQERVEDLKNMYVIERMDHPLFFVATRKDNNTKVFVKKFGKFNEWKQFKNEVETVKRLNHQCVITINRVMYDDHLYYVEMPFISQGTLYNWLFKSKDTVFTMNSKNERSGFEVQQMMRIVIQTIDYLHENGVIHRDIKMENIMMQTEQLPMIIDFDMSKDNQNSNRMSVSTMKGGTLKYMDPEVQLGTATLNTCSDIYSFGVTMLKCFSKYPIKNDVFVMPNKEFPDLKMSDFIIEDEDLIQLLKRCLHIKQAQRPTTQEIIYSPFFLKHLSNDKEKVLTTTSRIVALKKYMTDKRKNRKSEVFLELKTADLLEQVSELVVKSSTASLYKRFTVKFEGEDGIDQGALTTSMFRKYFEQLVVKKLLIQGSNCFHICIDQPVAMDERRKIMLAIGIMLCKCLYELRSIGDIELSSVLIKYLIASSTKSVTVSMSDYESFDMRMSNHLSNLHLYPDLSDLCLDFSGLKENGENIELTSENLSEYIQLTIQNEMINKRKQNLEWIKEGFQRMSDLKEHLQMLQVNDYHILLTGEQMIDIPSIVNNCILFIGFDNVPTQQQQQLYLNLQKWLKEILMEMSQEEFKQFLLFCTGHSRTETKNTLFSNGNLRRSGYVLDKINIKVIKEWNTNHLPQSRVCFYLLDLPLYTNKQQLEQKLKLAICNSNDSFYMA